MICGSRLLVRQVRRLHSDSAAEALPSYRFVKEASLRVIAAPFSFGQPREGVNNGPAAILEHGSGLVAKIGELAQRGSATPVWRSIDEVDVEPAFELAMRRRRAEAVSPAAGRLHRCLQTGVACDVVHTAVSEAARSGRFALTLGGDHSLALGTISGVLAAHGDVGVVWVDAHADINTALTTPSGNLHGCPVSFLLGLDQGDQPRPGFDWLAERRFPLLRPQRIAYIALRDVDSGERAILAEQRILALSMRDVRRHGIAEVVRRAVDHIDPSHSIPIHCSFDIDAVDPVWANSTGTPVAGGLTVSESVYLNESLARTGRLVSFDLMEVNPGLGSPEDVQRTALTAQTLICSALGQTYLD